MEPFILLTTCILHHTPDCSPTRTSSYKPDWKKTFKHQYLMCSLQKKISLIAQASLLKPRQGQKWFVLNIAKNDTPYHWVCFQTGQTIWHMITVLTRCARCDQVSGSYSTTICIEDCILFVSWSYACEWKQWCVLLVLRGKYGIQQADIWIVTL